MTRYRLTRKAAEDLAGIWSYIAHYDPDAADRVESAIMSACSLVGRSPMAGRERRDITDKPVRFWTVQPFPNYVVIYSPSARPVRVLRILHGMRNLPNLL